jgi:hypothetical protein
MSYLQYVLGTAASVLALAACLNYFVDPAGIYREGGINPTAYADALIASEHGLWKPDDAFDERLVAKAMAKYAQTVECVVIGSSHVMQIGSARNPKFPSNTCRSIMNLGVSGASIEDHLTLGFLIFQSEHPNKVLLGIDPWTFAFGKDARWVAYKGDYLQSRDIIFGEKSTNYANDDSVELTKLKNLINLEYVVRSATAMAKNVIYGAPKITSAPKINISVGGELPLRLKDGSHVYSAKYIDEASKLIVPIGGAVYKTDGELNQPHAVEAYRKLIRWIKKGGAEPIFILTPYHENVWKVPDSRTTRALRETESVAKELARDMGVLLIGSYDPRAVGCLPSEFYDFMHPTADCLEKVYRFVIRPHHER